MEPVTTMPVVERTCTASYRVGLLSDGLMLMVGALLILLLLLLLWHSIKASRGAQTCRLAHYIELTKCIGMIGFGAGLLCSVYKMMRVGFFLAEAGSVNEAMLWGAVAVHLEYLVLGTGIFLWAHIQALIFQFVAAKEDKTPPRT